MPRLLVEGKAQDLAIPETMGGRQRTLINVTVAFVRGDGGGRFTSGVLSSRLAICHFIPVVCLSISHTQLTPPPTK